MPLHTVAVGVGTARFRAAEKKSQSHPIVDNSAGRVHP